MKNNISAIPTIANVKMKPNIIIYGLNCVSFPPRKSHPKRYMDKDGKKFLDLYKKSLDTSSTLILVNYSNSLDEVKVMTVSDVTETEISTYGDVTMTIAQYQKWMDSVQERYNII